MKLRDFVEQNNIEGIVRKYIATSFVLYKNLGIDILDFDYDTENDVVSAEVTPQEFAQAHESVVHGGLVATYIDTIAGTHAMVHSLKNNQVSFTKELKITYMAPMIIGIKYQIVSTHADKSFNVEIKDGENIICQAELIFAFK